jgi:hypothetical protein
MMNGVPEPELVSRVAQSTGLTQREAARVVADVVAYYAESTEAFIRRRHAGLQARGLRNPEIFAQIHAELARRVVAPPALSERQIRRIVYG